MAKYEFALILKGQYELTEEIADELFEAGCDDGTLGVCNSIFSIDFHREGDSLEAAIRSAIADVKSAGYEVERAESKPKLCQSLRKLHSTATSGSAHKVSSIYMQHRDGSIRIFFIWVASLRAFTWYMFGWDNTRIATRR